MTKIAIKKNVKPKTVKQKQKQTQKTNVTVNIGSSVIKKKRGRPSKKAQPVKQPINPVIQSFNQPMFKQSTPQPTSLTSSILATQDKPKVIAEEVKEQSTLKKALIDQNISTEEPKVNELERVRSERIKKVEKPKIEIIKEEPIRHALLGQLLADQQDDTEEIQSLFQPSGQTTIYPQSSSSVSNVSSLTASGTSTPTPLSRPVNAETLTNKLKQIQQTPETQEEIIADEESQPENPLTNQQQEPTTTILEEETKKPSTITQSLQAEETVRPADQYTTETLVEVKNPSEAEEGSGSTPNNDNPGLEEFTARIKAFPNNATLIDYIKKNNITMPKEKNRNGYEMKLIKAFKDGKISLTNV